MAYPLSIAYPDTHISRQLTPAKLAHASSLRTYFRSLRRAKAKGDEKIIREATHRISSWKAVLSIEQLVKQAPSIMENGQDSFYMFFDGARYFFTTDRNYGTNYLSGDWAVTRYLFVFSSYNDGGMMTIRSGIAAALEDLQYHHYIKSIGSADELCEYVNTIRFGGVVVPNRYRDIGLNLIKDPAHQEYLLNMASQIDY